MEDEVTKKAKLRNNEYYFLQDLFDFLNKRSKKNYIFYNLMDYISRDANIRLAYRNIKKNKGSKTNGLSGKNISFIANLKLWTYIKLIKSMLKNYEPSMIKRVGIPKPNGKIRYLGIKESWDKIVEQSIYQVLEPIITAKFHNNSNGFISGRSCARAISQFNSYVVNKKLYYVIDIDIKGFFDNVNHGKLLKQLWTIGIRDKNLICLISKMLKAEIFNLGVPDKGTPQGGILSPLLANVVLNELDWWLDSKKSKGIYFVRYADDVRIICPTYSVARNMLEQTTNWLKKRLKLEVSEEKTKIVNLKKNAMDFLGSNIKVKFKSKRPRIVSHIEKGRLKKCEKRIKEQIRKIKRYKTNPKRCNEEVILYNSIVMGIHNYYDMNNMISKDLFRIGRIIQDYIHNNLSDVLTFDNKTDENDFIIKKYGKNLPYIRGFPLIPIENICYRPRHLRKENINYFDSNLRKSIHKELNINNMFILERILKLPMLDKSVELNDIILSKFCGNLGKYSITNKMILDVNNLNVIKSNNKKGHKYDNILLVENKVKNLIELESVDDMIEIYNLTKGLTREQLEKINKIRKENSLPLFSY